MESSKQEPLRLQLRTRPSEQKPLPTLPRQPPLIEPAIQASRRLLLQPAQRSANTFNRHRHHHW